MSFLPSMAARPAYLVWDAPKAYLTPGIHGELPLLCVQEDRRIPGAAPAWSPPGLFQRSTLEVNGWTWRVLGLPLAWANRVPLLVDPWIEAHRPADFEEVYGGRLWYRDAVREEWKPWKPS